jgi:hypothetical protein
MPVIPPVTPVQEYGDYLLYGGISLVVALFIIYFKDSIEDLIHSRRDGRYEIPDHVRGGSSYEGLNEISRSARPSEGIGWLNEEKRRRRDRR